MVFNGSVFANKTYEEISGSIKRLGKLKLGSIYDQSNSGAVKYTAIKEKKAEELGIEFVKFTQADEILMRQLSEDQSVNGIMIQLPFPNSEELIKLIDPKKDVDGLKEDSLYKPAAVRAVREIVREPVGLVVIVGNRGVVGRGLMREFPEAVGMDKDDFDPDKLKTADVIISATGQEALIKSEMVKEGFKGIDLGYPKGDFAHSALLMASFYTPVPGGVGPVTVAMLFKNLVESCEI